MPNTQRNQHTAEERDRAKRKAIWWLIFAIGFIGGSALLGRCLASPEGTTSTTKPDAVATTPTPSTSSETPQGQGTAQPGDITQIRGEKLVKQLKQSRYQPQPHEKMAYQKWVKGDTTVVIGLNLDATPPAPGAIMHIRRLLEGDSSQVLQCSYGHNDTKGPQSLAQALSWLNVIYQREPSASQEDKETGTLCETMDA